MKESSGDEQGKFWKLTDVIETLKRLSLGFFFFFFFFGGKGWVDFRNVYFWLNEVQWAFS